LKCKELVFMNIIKKIPKYFMILIISFISIIPFYVLLLLALGDPSEKSLLPLWYFRNFVEAWNKSNIGVSIINSFIITTGAIIIIILFASSAGYVIARFNNKFNSIIFWTLLACMMIPGIINTIPLYVLVRSINGINTRWAMILILATNALPFSVFLYTSFIKSIPKDIEEAAIIDGCTRFTAFWRVTFPLLKPVTAAVTIINGVGIWNNYAQAIFFLQIKSTRTIPLSISMFFQRYGADWNLMAATSIIGIAPILVMFLFFQKYFIEGLSMGSIKG